MADKLEFGDLFGKRKATASPAPPTDPDADEDLGPCCAAVARYKTVQALTVKHAGKPWETLPYGYLALNCYYEPTRFTVDFRDADHRRRLIVTGRNLERVYLLCVESRLTWLRAADRDFADDGETVVTKIEVVEVKVER